MRYSNYAFKVPEEKIVRVIIDTDAKKMKLMTNLQLYTLRSVQNWSM